MQDLAQLIEAAAGATGSQTALGKALGVLPHRISEWKGGHRPCPLHVQAQIAELAGVNAKDWVWRQICHQLGRAVAAVALTLAALFAASGVPGAGGALALRR